jgi:CII-binding regulator of phage lambda lysogenization HflD
MSATASYQLWPLSEVRERATSDDAIKSIKIAYDHVPKPTGYIVAEIVRNPDGSWNEAQFRNFEKNRGRFTAFFLPKKEVIFLDSRSDDDHNQFKLDLSDPMNGLEQARRSYANKDVMQLVDKLLESEKKVAVLEEQVKMLEEALDEYSDNKKRFVSASGDIINQIILPGIMSWFQPQQQFKPQQSMQGQQVENDLHDIDWKNIPVQSMEDALTVLVAAFGVDTITKLAKKLQQQPHMVNMVQGFANS